MHHVNAPLPASPLYFQAFGTHDLSHIDMLEDSNVLSLIPVWDEKHQLPDVDCVNTWREARQRFIQARKSHKELFDSEGNFFASDREVSRVLGREVTREEVYGKGFDVEDFTEFLESFFSTSDFYSISHARAEAEIDAEKVLYHASLPVLEYVITHDVVRGPHMDQEVLPGSKMSGYMRHVAARPAHRMKFLCYDNMVYMNYQQNIVVHEEEEERQLISEYVQCDGNVSPQWTVTALQHFGGWWT